MTGQPPTFEIHESRIDGHLRLSLTGDLDLVSTPVLEHRLARLRVLRDPVRLDLSKLDFIDSTGLQVLIRELGEARAKHWELGVDRDISPLVMQLFRLAHIEHAVFKGEADVVPSRRAHPMVPASEAPPAA